MTRDGVARLQQRLAGADLSASFGVVEKIDATMLTARGLSPGIGDIVRIVAQGSVMSSMGMVTALSGSSFAIAPFGFLEGFRIGDRVYLVHEGMKIPVGQGLLGRVVDPLMRPLDGKGEIFPESYYPMIRPPIGVMKRGLIDATFETGVKSIDGLLTCGHGQKLGIFAGSGVGKSTLMGMIVRGAQVPVKVVALIGERGREVPEFIEKSLGGDLTNTVIVVATSDDSALMRKYGAFAAMSVAEFFKDRGEDVLFLMDSVTRFAMAQRDIGLALGEPPTSKGYPPSVLTLMPQLMERAGKEEGKGSITAFFTVLVEGDDMSDPIADQARSILDGHIVLSRDMTDFGIYPPVNVLASASRVMNSVVSKEHLEAARKFRRMYHLIKENEILVRIGAYQRGSDAELDKALDKKGAMEDFLRQEQEAIVPFEAVRAALSGLAD